MTTLTGREATARPLTTRSHRNRAARTTGRIAWKTTRWLVRKGWQHRTALAPLYATVTAYIVAVTEYILGGYGTITIATGTVGGLTIAKLRGLPLPAKLAITEPRDRYLTIGLWAALVTITTLGIVTANIGGGIPMPGIWALTAVAVTAAWWTHLATRTADTATMLAATIRETWKSKVSAQKGPIPGSTLGKVSKVDGKSLAPEGHLGPIVDRAGWTAHADLDNVGSSAEAVINPRNAAKVAAAYRTSSLNVLLGHDDVKSEHRVKVTVMTRNPASDIVTYDPDVWQTHQDGCIPIAVCSDGTVPQYRVWMPGSGSAHTLIAGNSGSGKSKGVGAIITGAAATGRVVPIIADPQGGASLPAWGGHSGVAPVIARDGEAIEELFGALEHVAAERADFIAGLGIGDWDVDTMLREHGRPMLLVVLDEAHMMLMGNPEFTQRVATAAKIWRKVGMGMVLLTQTPNLEEIGGSQAIRQNVASGNVISFPTNSRTSGGMILPPSAPDPYTIPPIVGRTPTQGMCVMATSAPFGMPTNVARFPFLTGDLAASEAIRLARDIIPDLDPAAAERLGVDIPAWRKRVNDIADGTAEPDNQPSALVEQGRATAKARILDYLRTTESSAIETAQIVADLQLKPSTVSTTLKRLAEDGHVESPGHGLWKAK